MINYLTGVIVGILITTLYFKTKKRTCNCCKKTDKPEDMEYGIK